MLGKLFQLAGHRLGLPGKSLALTGTCPAVLARLELLDLLIEHFFEFVRLRQVVLLLALLQRLVQLLQLLGGLSGALPGVSALVCHGLGGTLHRPLSAGTLLPGTAEALRVLLDEIVQRTIQLALLVG